MRRLKFVSLIVGIVILSAAGQAAMKGDSAFVEGPNGSIMHRESGFVFPAHIGNFHRRSEDKFDAMGHDVSVSYFCSPTPIVATLYVYPTGGLSLDQEFQRRQSEVEQAHPGAKLMSRGATTVSPKRVRALTAEYQFSGNFGGSDQALHSVLIVAQRGPRFIEYRMTFPSSERTAAAAQAAKLSQQFAWPK